MLWSDATDTMVAAYSIDTGDVRFDRGEWCSNWVRGRNARIKVGQYSSGDRPRWVAVAESKLEEATHPSIAAARLTGPAPKMFLHFIEVFWQYKKMAPISK